MSDVISSGGKTSAPDLFQGAAEYYARYRRPYAEALEREIASEFGPLNEMRILDLGSGPGTIALRLAARDAEVWAVDPDYGMLVVGLAEQAAHPELLGIRWLLASDSSIAALRLPQFNVCTMGASFHWMAREKVLQDLDTMISRDGGVVLASVSASVWGCIASELPWPSVVREVVQRFLGPQRRAGSQFYKEPQARHEAVLEKSPFSEVTKSVHDVTEWLSIDDIVGLQLSTSYASPALLGDRLPEFIVELRQRLGAIANGRPFRSTTRTELLLARRRLRWNGC